MITAKKTINAAVGVGSLALEKARQVPQQITQLPTTLRSRDITIAPIKIDATKIRKFQQQLDVRDLPKTARTLGQSGVDTAKGFLDDAKKLQKRTSKRAEKLYNDLSKRGEKVVKKVRGSAATKRATTRTKTAKSQVKAASTSVQKAASAGVDAVVDAADKASAEQAS